MNAVIVSLLLLVFAGVARAQQPNVIVIIADDQSVDSVSAYGTTVGNISTPNIDRIAAAGVRFTDYYVSNSICGPFRAAFLTGKYAHGNGVYANANKLTNDFDATQQTLPKLLDAAGYQTSIIGKWGFATKPVAGTGWDDWRVFVGEGRYDDPDWATDTGMDADDVGYSTDIITDYAIAWMQARDPANPFFLVLSHIAPHLPSVPRAGDEVLFTTDIAHPESFDDDLSGHSPPARQIATQLRPGLLDTWQQPIYTSARPDGYAKETMPEDLTEAEKDDWIFQQYVKDYLRCVKSLDENVGRILDYLVSEGIEGETLVIYVADNGALLGEHFLRGKISPYEASIHPPLLMQYPGTIAPGTTESHFATEVDLAPTILAYAGQAVPSDMHGESLEDLLDGSSPTNWRSAVYLHTYNWNVYQGTVPYFGLRTARYKLVYYYGQEWGGAPAWELTDLQTDPSELTNVYADAQYAGVIAQLKAEIASWQTSLGIPPIVTGCAGDVNLDGFITWLDFSTAKKCFNSLAVGACRRADFDGNDLISAAELLRIGRSVGQACTL